MKLGSLNEISTVLDDLILARLREEVVDYLQEQNLMFLRGITLGEDEDEAGMDRLKPKLLPGHRDAEADELDWPLDHPGARVYKQEGREFTHLFPSDHLFTILVEQAELRFLSIFPATEGTLIVVCSTGLYEAFVTDV